MRDSRDGILEEADGGLWRLRFVRRLRHAPDVVWASITEPSHMAAWMPARMEGERRAGAKLRFVFPEEPSYDSRGEIVVYDPPRAFEYAWEDERLRFELRLIDGGTELTFLTTFADVGKAARDAAGWHACLDALAAHLDGGDGVVARDGWRTLAEKYRGAFPPEASTVGPPEWHPESRSGTWPEERRT